ncbi:XkdQ/YqbQ family protein [Bacillus sp. FSL K6-3431]|uniref:XkdQ/YqbQ family protein n=1 Tax=Bacillus sp. FSL K6-3431 TaxID=2921500 RepID=UPI0030F6FA03
MEVLIDNRNGTVLDIPVASIEWKTERIGKAGSFEASLVLEDPAKYPIVNGAVLRAMDKKQKIFYGYVFESNYTKDGEVSVKAYDQLRYLMNQDTFVLPATTASNAIKKIASDFGLKLGTITNTGYVVPGVVEDDKQALDVVSKYLDSTLIATNQNFVLYDDFGALALRNIHDIAIPADDFYIGEDSLLFAFDYTKSIDKETANRVKLVHDNEKTSKREVYIVQDSKNIAKWGRLQKFRKVDANMTAAQIKDLSDKMIKLLNREIKTLELECLGQWKVRAGCFVYIYIEKLGIKEYFLVDECSHEWSEGIHTMSLKVKVI